MPIFVLYREFCGCPSGCQRQGVLLEKGLLFCLCWSCHATVCGAWTLGLCTPAEKLAAWGKPMSVCSKPDSQAQVFIHPVVLK